MRILGKVSQVAAVVVGLSLTLSAHAESKRYLVKFKSDQTFSALSKKVSASRAQDQLANVARRDVKLFNSNVSISQPLDQVKLMIVETDDAAAIESLKNNPSIALVEEEMFFPAPQPMNVGPAITADSNLREQVDMPWGIDAVKAPAAWNTTKGANTRVLVLDTGLDTGHQAIVGRYEQGRNFTGGSATDLTDQVGHGTHVAGTVLADGGGNGLLGVAPESRLLMGKVCGTNGCSTVAITAGLNWAVAERVDVVNLSLGGMFMSAGEQAALVAAEQAGVVIVAASGNDGRRGVSYPAAFTTSFAVGAVDSTLKKADFSNWGPELDIVAPGVEVNSSVPRGTSRVSDVAVNVAGKGLEDAKSQYLVGSPMSPLTTNDLVFVGLGKPEDFAGKDVRGKYALIARGEIAFKDKVAAAIQNGATGVLIFNNAPGLIVGGLTEDGSEVAVPVTMIEQTVGEALKAALTTGQTAQAAFGVVPSDYSVFAGTSMASPHVAGVVALIRSANKNLSPAQIRDLIKATATPLGPNDQNQYGAGMINAEAAVAAAVAFVPESLRAAN